MVGLGLSLAICFQMQWAIGENQVILYSILVYLELLIKPVFTLSTLQVWNKEVFIE